MGVTGVEKVTYVGHSQGTLQMFAALSDNIQYYRKRMKLFVAIAPVVSVKNLGSQTHKDYAASKTAFGALMSIGPEIFSHAATDSIVKKVAVSSSVGA